MNPRMILLTTAAAAALGAAAATEVAGAAPTAGLRVAPSSYTAPHRQHAGMQTSLRAKKLLHNPGLPPWIP